MRLFYFILFILFIYLFVLQKKAPCSVVHSLGLHKVRPGNRVWKSILGIRDLTKIRCGIRENAKYLDGNRDLTALWEAGFAKVWAPDAGIFVCREFGKSSRPK